MAMMDKAGVALAVADRAGKIILANKAFARLVGVERLSLIGAVAPGFIHHEYRSTLFRTVKNLVRVSMFEIDDDDPALQHQAEYPLSAGTRRWIDLSLTVDRCPAGKIVHFIIAASDISARKRLEDVQLLSANAFESALTAMRNVWRIWPITII
jgi:PAS domain S-box-containing protein